MNDVSKEEKLDPAKPILWIVIPCYNEKDVLPITAPMFLEQIQTMISKEKISAKSRILFVNDGSKDSTWDIICKLKRMNIILESVKVETEDIRMPYLQV